MSGVIENMSLSDFWRKLTKKNKTYCELNNITISDAKELYLDYLYDGGHSGINEFFEELRDGLKPDLFKITSKFTMDS